MHEMTILPKTFEAANKDLHRRSRLSDHTIREMIIPPLGDTPINDIHIPSVRDNVVRENVDDENSDIGNRGRSASLDITVSTQISTRRQFVWKWLERGERQLQDVSRQFGDILTPMGGRVKTLPRFKAIDNNINGHNCRGYRRSEISFTHSMEHSAVISHTSPVQGEICSICSQFVRSSGIFDCICGQRAFLLPSMSKATDISCS